MRHDQTAHQEFIPWLCRLIGAASYLELGVYDGACLDKVARANPDMRVVGVDRVQTTLLLPANVTFILSNTDKYLSELTAETMFDVVFIDADHSKESVLEDLRLVLPHVPNNGLILLHDTFPASEIYTASGYCGTAYQAAESLSNVEGLEIVTLPYHPGLSVIRKRVKQTAW